MHLSRWIDWYKTQFSMKYGWPCLIFHPRSAHDWSLGFSLLISHPWRLPGPAEEHRRGSRGRRRAALPTPPWQTGAEGWLEKGPGSLGIVRPCWHGWIWEPKGELLANYISRKVLWFNRVMSINQSIHQSTKHLINQSTKQLSDQSIRQSTKQLISHSIHQSIDTSIS